MTFSAIQLDGARQLLAFGYRASLYASAVILLLYLMNLPERKIDVPRLAQAAGFLWLVTVVGGFAGLALPNVGFTSPLEMVLPSSIANEPFVRSLVHPEFSSSSALLGYDLARPKAPYNYTNEWGSNLALLTPLAIYSMLVVRRRWWRMLIGLSLLPAVVPAVLSINRGLWISVAVGAAYVAVRAAMRGRIRLLVAVVAVAAAAVVGVAMSSLADVVADRAANANLQGRVHLYDEAARSALESPILGHGAPLPSDDTDLTAGASIGTHGQLWTLLVSHGVPGVVMFVGFLVVTILRTHRVSMQGLWPQAALVIAVFQLPFYNSLPVQLHIVMLAVALCWWDVRARRARLRPTPATPLPPAGPVAA